MKKLIFILSVLLLACVTRLPAPQNLQPRVAFTNSLTSAASVTNPPASPLIHQEFEGTGYDNGEAWNVTGTATKDPDYTGVVISGSQSLRIASAGFDTAQAYVAISAIGEVWGYSKIRIVTLGSVQVFQFQDSGFTELMSVKQTSSGFQVSVAGSLTPSTTGTGLSTGVTYDVWWHYLKGSGANAVGEVWFSTNGTKPADGSAGHAKVSDGTTTANVTYCVLGHVGGTTTAETIYDHVYFDDAVILSNP